MAAAAGELEDPWMDHPSIHLSVREIDILLGGVKNTEVVNNLSKQQADGRNGPTRRRRSRRGQAGFAFLLIALSHLPNGEIS